MQLGSVMEISPMIGVGVSDLQSAARAEVARIAKQSDGDEVTQTRLLLDGLISRDLITAREATVLVRLAEIAYEAGNDKLPAADAYLESRTIFDHLLVTGKSSPVALAIASSAVGSYAVEPAPGGGVVFKKSNGSWESRGAAAGAIIGSAWGPLGAAIGGAVGGLVGGIVDECKS